MLLTTHADGGIISNMRIILNSEVSEMTKKRVIAAIMAALILCAIVCSLVFIRIEAHHDCRGDDCPVCEHIALCRDALWRLSRVIIAAFALVGAASTLILSDVREKPCRAASTPVLFGVKMLN